MRLHKKKIYYPTNLVTVDTGENTAFAFWIGDNKPITCSFSVANKSKPHEEKLIDLWSKFEETLNGHLSELSIMHCIIETPKLWGDNLKSLAAAKKGNLFYLATLVGGYCRICNSLGISFKLVYPDEWKGQLGKRTIAEWIYRINGETYPNDHTSDAVGIGFWANGWKKSFKWKNA